MQKSEQINELMAALSKAQGEILGAKADQKNTYFNSKYADLASVINAIREPLAKYGLAHSQLVSGSDGAITVTTILGHSSGQFISDSVSFKPQKTDPQSAGSAVSYFRRYSLGAIVGIAQVDDDAEAVMDRSVSAVITPNQRILWLHGLAQDELKKNALLDRLRAVAKAHNFAAAEIYMINEDLNGVKQPKDCTLEQLQALVNKLEEKVMVK